MSFIEIVMALSTYTLKHARRIYGLQKKRKFFSLKLFWIKCHNTTWTHCYHVKLHQIRPVQLWS